MIASAVMYARLVLIVGVISAGFVRAVAPPLLLMFLVLVVLSSWAWHVGRKETHERLTQENPSELKPALFFGLMYAVVLFGAAAAKEFLGSSGLYFIAAISGLTDVDPITVSTSQLAGSGRLEMSEGWRLILVATLTNFVFKAALAGVLGSRKLVVQLAPFFGIALACGLLLLFFWPY
jgi:uncharacterized membrane protein (DUF4010 family)